MLDTAKSKEINISSVSDAIDFFERRIVFTRFGIRSGKIN